MWHFRQAISTIRVFRVYDPARNIYYNTYGFSVHSLHRTTTSTHRYTQPRRQQAQGKLKTCQEARGWKKQERQHLGWARTSGELKYSMRDTEGWGVWVLGVWNWRLTNRADNPPGFRVIFCYYCEGMLTHYANLAIKDIYWAVRATHV